MVGRCIILLLISYESMAQTYVSPSYQAMGCTGTALQGIHSLTANPAGLVGLERATVSLGYQQHFLTSEITTQAALLGIPTRLGTFGATGYRYGLSGAYDDITGGLAFAKGFGPSLSIGMMANYHQLFVPRYLVVYSFSVDVGVQYRLADHATIGLQYTNVGHADYGEDVYGFLPAHIRVGGSYRLGLVDMALDAVYRFQQEPGAHVGLAYRIAAPLSLRGGLSVNPMAQHAGFGIHWQGFAFDAAATFHPRLGTSPQIGISYAF